MRFPEINVITARLLQPMETDPEASARALLHTFAEGVQHSNPGAVIEGDSREEYQMTRIIELQQGAGLSRTIGTTPARDSRFLDGGHPEAEEPGS